MNPGELAWEECRIRRLLAEYCHLNDNYRPDDWCLLFTEDAEFVQTSPAPLGRAVCRGRHEIRSHLADRPNNWIPLRHFTSTSIIDIAPDGLTARAWSNFVALQEPFDSGGISGFGVYTDELVRSPERWRFRSRVVSLAGLVPAALLFAGGS